jgi:hypothetical protein
MDYILTSLGKNCAIISKANEEEKIEWLKPKMQIP